MTRGTILLSLTHEIRDRRNAPHIWRHFFTERKNVMDKDRVVGTAKIVKGKVKVAVGKALGDAKLESEG